MLVSSLAVEYRLRLVALMSLRFSFEKELIFVFLIYTGLSVTCSGAAAPMNAAALCLMGFEKEMNNGERPSHMVMLVMKRCLL